MIDGIDCEAARTTEATGLLREDEMSTCIQCGMCGVGDSGKERGGPTAQPHERKTRHQFQARFFETMMSPKVA